MKRGNCEASLDLRAVEEKGQTQIKFFKWFSKYTRNY